MKANKSIELEISTKADIATALSFCDGWHVVSVTTWGYLHDVSVVAYIRYIEGAEHGTSRSECRKEINRCFAIVKQAWETVENDYAAAYHKWQ